jgi:hypothetical protein
MRPLVRDQAATAPAGPPWGGVSRSLSGTKRPSAEPPARCYGLRGTMPTVSIGVPAHNEAQFIAEALDSVLAQELTDWQLTVSDNRSTDGTDEIVRRYAERDPRIRLDRVSTSVSQNENFNRLAREASTPYFVWLGAHDRWHPTFLSECVAALGADERHVLAFTDVFIIDPSGERLPVGYSPATLSRKFSTLLSLDTRLCLTPEARFITFLFGGMNGVHIHGVIRGEALRRTSLLRPCLLPDITFVAELALLGTFARVEGPPLFELRMLREKSWAERALLLSEQGAPAWAGVLPWYHLASECVTAPLRVAAPMRTRAVAMGGAVACALTSLLPQLRNELREAVRNGFTTRHHETSRPVQHETITQAIKRALGTPFGAGRRTDAQAQL